MSTLSRMYLIYSMAERYPCALKKDFTKSLISLINTRQLQGKKYNQIPIVYKSL